MPHNGANPLDLKTVETGAQGGHKGLPATNLLFARLEKENTILTTIYTKPGCPACTQSMRLMDKLNIDYTEAPITEDVLAFAKDRGLTQAPIITIYRTGDTINEASAWSGFYPEKIKQLAEEQ